MKIPKFNKDEWFQLCSHDYSQYIIHFLSARPFLVI